MKKLCFCTTISATMKQFVLETARYLQQTEGFDITLICQDDPEFRKELPAGIRFRPVPMKRGMDLSGFAAVLAFLRIFREEGFDLVAYSTPNAACYASIAAKACGVPVRVYGQWGIRYVGLSGFSRRWMKRVEGLVCRNSTAIRPVSEGNRAFAIDEGLYPPEKAKVLGFGGTIGVDFSLYDRAKKEDWRQMIRNRFGLSPTDFVFGFCGRISADKGCHELFRAFRALLQKGERAFLLVVGPLEVKGELDSTLLAWARNCPSVCMTGAVSVQEMPKYYAAMDVLVHPTYREGFGMVLQEAGALGVPAITTDIPGASEVMEDGRSTLLVPPGDWNELEHVMRALLHHPKQALRLGEQAYRRTLACYNRTEMLKRQRDDFCALLQEAEGKGAKK